RKIKRQVGWSSQTSSWSKPPISKGRARLSAARGADFRALFVASFQPSPMFICPRHGNIVGFFTLTPQTWHLIYGGTAPQTTHRAKKNPSNTYPHFPHSHRPARLMSPPHPGHGNESLVIKIQAPIMRPVRRHSW